MFPFRRQGPKKRNKNNNARRVRGPQKGLPNSARDLLPVLQPATKALAQMLAGRANVSGQLAHAQSVLAHAERLIAERTHNRLNPREREEFFEQLARLRLTIADAEAEAEAVAAEDQQPKPVVAPVDQERLRAMALALSRPADERTGGQGPAAVPAEADEGEEAAADVRPQPSDEPGSAAQPDDQPGREARVSAANARSGRLQLSRGGGGETDPVGGPVGMRRSRTKQAVGPVGNGSERAAGPEATAASGAAEGSAQGSESEPAPRAAEPPAAPRRRLKPQPRPAQEDEDPASAVEQEGGNGSAPEVRRTRRRKTAGLPDGWVIDDEGFVVPGPR